MLEQGRERNLVQFVGSFMEDRRAQIQFEDAATDIREIKCGWVATRIPTREHLSQTLLGPSFNGSKTICHDYNPFFGCDIYDSRHCSSANYSLNHYATLGIALFLLPWEC